MVLENAGDLKKAVDCPMYFSGGKPVLLPGIDGTVKEEEERSMLWLVSGSLAKEVEYELAWASKQRFVPISRKDPCGSKHIYGFPYKLVDWLDIKFFNTAHNHTVLVLKKSINGIFLQEHVQWSQVPSVFLASFFCTASYNTWILVWFLSYFSVKTHTQQFSYQHNLLFRTKYEPRELIFWCINLVLIHTSSLSFSW